MISPDLCFLAFWQIETFSILHFHDLTRLILFSVLAKGLNDGGRGFNIVIVDPKTKGIIRVGHFDTYAEGNCTKVVLVNIVKTISIRN